MLDVLPDGSRIAMVNVIEDTKDSLSLRIPRIAPNFNGSGVRWARVLLAFT